MTSIMGSIIVICCPKYPFLLSFMVRLDQHRNEAGVALESGLRGDALGEPAAA